MSEKHVSINIFDLIQQLCGEFRGNWKSNRPPRIEDYLTKVPENARETLFRNLLPVDIRYRERNGQQPSADDYLKRFPKFQRAVGDAFNYTISLEVQAVDETTECGDVEVNSDATKGYGTVPPQAAGQCVQRLAASRIGEYELIRELGRGGFGVVYEVLHVRHRTKVALKTLLTGVDGQEINAERLHKFRGEFRSLAEINHPNLVGMQTLEVEGGQWFFTMDLVDGTDFLGYVRPDGQLDEARLRSALRQLAVGVSALHDRSILHCDLKPSNVLVSSDGHVSILDFGLVTHLQQYSDQTATLQSQHFAGTPRYAAPEQIFGERYPASDWYAIGTMLYEALVGQAPFNGSAAQILVKKRVEDPRTLSGRDDVPTDLAALVDHLLYREPSQRAIPEEISKALGLDCSTISRGSHDDETSELRCSEEYSAPALIGREEQLAALERAKRDFLSNRRPEVVWISGLSGEGKSSLADKFLDSFRIDKSALVLSGRCYDRESVPFKVVDVLIESLVRFLRSRQTDQVTTWLPRDIQMLASLFPSLHRVESIARQPPLDLQSLDDRQIRYRGFYALGELLVTIGRETPIVMFIDDLQWGDADSAEVVVDMLSGAHPPALLLLGSYRSDEADQSPFLQEWSQRTVERDKSLNGTNVNVCPLTEDQCVEFVSKQIGISPADLDQQARDLLADTKGNPYFLEQLIEGFDSGTGKFEPVPLREIVERKLSLLPETARDLLIAIAIAGQAVAVDEVSSVSGHDTPLFATITHMRSERLVRLIGSGGQELVDTYHDKIRETLHQSLGNDERQSVHLRFGKLIEKKEQISAKDVLQYLDQDASSTEQAPAHTERIVDLAFHFHAAGDPQSWIYQLMAGEIAYRLYASEDAVSFLNRADKTCPDDVSDHIKYRLYHRLGTSRSRLKQFGPASEAYQTALQFANSKLAKAHAHAGVAVVQQSQGKFALATKSNDAALNELGRKRPRGIRAIVRMLWQLASVFLIPSGWFRKEGGNVGRINAFERKRTRFPS